MDSISNAAPAQVRLQTAPLAGSGPGQDDITAPDGPPAKSLTVALRAARIDLDRSREGSETSSEEEYDENIRPAIASVVVGAGRQRQLPITSLLSLNEEGVVTQDDSSVHIFPDDDHSIRDFLTRSSQRAREADPTKRPGKFSDLVFTRQFSAFDRHNAAAVNSPFHGFYTLFWLAVALFVLKISADNWRKYGTPLGSSDIVKTMFDREGTLNVGNICRQLIKISIHASSFRWHHVWSHRSKLAVTKARPLRLLSLGPFRLDSSARKSGSADSSAKLSKR